MTKFIRRFTAQRARRYKVSSGPIRSPKVANPSGSGPGAIRSDWWRWEKFFEKLCFQWFLCLRGFNQWCGTCSCTKWPR